MNQLPYITVRRHEDTVRGRLHIDGEIEEIELFGDESLTEIENFREVAALLAEPHGLELPESIIQGAKGSVRFVLHPCKYHKTTGLTHGIKTTAKGRSIRARETGFTGRYVVLSKGDNSFEEHLAAAEQLAFSSGLIIEEYYAEMGKGYFFVTTKPAKQDKIEIIEY